MCKDMQNERVFVFKVVSLSQNFKPQFTKSSNYIDHHEIVLELWLDLLPSRVMLMMFSVRLSTSELSSA